MKDQNTLPLGGYILLLSLTCTISAPVQRRSINMADAHIWLKKFGYMATDNPSGTEEAEAMGSMQRFFGLRETLILDQETIDIMTLPRCGIPDMNPETIPGNRRRRYTLLGSPWDSTTLTYRFNNYTPDLSRTQVQSAIGRALGVWAEVTPITFTRIQDGTDIRSASDIEVLFGGGTHGVSHPADTSFDGSSSSGGNVLAHAFNPGSVRFPDLRGDMHFDEDERWQEAAGIDLFTVAAHEFGHSLGLGHSDIRGALMFPTYYGYDPNFRLHADDIAGIQSLYGARPTSPRPTTPKATPVPRTRTITAATESTTRMTRTAGTLDSYCNRFAVIDSVVTLYNTFDSVYTFAVQGRDIIPFGKDGEILENPLSSENLSVEIQAVFDAIWRDDGSPITAMVEKRDGSLVVFRGVMYWEYEVSDSQYRAKPGFPNNLSTLGLSENVEIIAALSVRDDGIIHLFSSSRYWSFDDNLISLDTNSPNMISSRWHGIPGDVDAAFSWQGNTCFVRSSQYWCLNETSSVRDMTEYPRSFNGDWFGCKDVGSGAATIKPFGTIMSFFCFVAAVSNVIFVRR